MRSLGLLVSLLAVAAPLKAQAPTQQLYPGEQVHALWERVIACAGPMRDTTQTFEGMTFYVRDSTYSEAGRLIKGEWTPPGTIYLTRGFETNGWVIAHEMLHHALNGPRLPADPHPMEAFIGCGLMEIQQPRPPIVGVTTISAPSPFYRYRRTDPLTNTLVDLGA
jgi:hypothetical protein